MGAALILIVLLFITIGCQSNNKFSKSFELWNKNYCSYTDKGYSCDTVNINTTNEIRNISLQMTKQNNSAFFDIVYGVVPELKKRGYSADKLINISDSLRTVNSPLQDVYLREWWHEESIENINLLRKYIRLMRIQYNASSETENLTKKYIDLMFKEDADLKDGNKKIEQMKKFCEIQKGNFYSHNLMSGTNFHCDFSLSDAGKKCRDSIVCYGKCIVNEDNPSYGYIINGSVIKCDKNCIGKCSEYFLDDCDNFIEIINGTYNVQYVFCD
jgi:hypothetical protein